MNASVREEYRHAGSYGYQDARVLFYNTKNIYIRLYLDFAEKFISEGSALWNGIAHFYEVGGNWGYSSRWFEKHLDLIQTRFYELVREDIYYQ